MYSTCGWVTSAIVPFSTWRASRTIRRSNSTRVFVAVVEDIFSGASVRWIGVGVRARVTAGSGDAEPCEIVLPALAVLLAHLRCLQAAMNETNVGTGAVPREGH